MIPAKRDDAPFIYFSSNVLPFLSCGVCLEGISFLADLNMYFDLVFIVDGDFIITGLTSSL